MTAHVLNLMTSGSLEQWRFNLSRELARKVQSDLHQLQNDLPCTGAETKLFCEMKYNFPCGLGCGVHGAAACLRAAFQLNRTFVLASKGWSYNANGYEEYFEPLSETCLIKPNQTLEPGLNWTGL
jgi:hypothetical protein